MIIYGNLCESPLFASSSLLRLRVFFFFRDDYKDYLLESRLQFRINAGLQTVKRMEN